MNPMARLGVFLRLQMTDGSSASHFLPSQDYGIDLLLDVGVACLSFGEYLTDEVNRSLDG